MIQLSLIWHVINRSFNNYNTSIHFSDTSNSPWKWDPSAVPTFGRDRRHSAKSSSDVSFDRFSNLGRRPLLPRQQGGEVRAGCYVNMGNLFSNRYTINGMLERNTSCSRVKVTGLFPAFHRQVASTLDPSITDVDVVSLPRKTSNVSILGDACRCVDSRRMNFFRGDLVCHLSVGRDGTLPIPSGNWYQPGLIDPAIAGETEHLVGKTIPCEFYFDS